MLHEFLVQNQSEILEITEKKTVELADPLSSSDRLRQGLPIFFEQLLAILLLKRPAVTKSAPNLEGASMGAEQGNESAVAIASGRPEEGHLAESAGMHGAELLRLGYTLSHVVHAYGAMCQAITELATKKKFPVSTTEFHDLNQCLDVAIAGAVTQFQAVRDHQEVNREVEHLGVLAHEMRNALTSASISFQLIKKGTIGAGGSTGEVVVKSLKRIEDLINRSLTEVRLSIDPAVHVESCHVLYLVNQILVAAEVEAHSRNQKIINHVEADLICETDQEALHSALSNLIQNALKYSPIGGTIEVRAKSVGENVILEVEDQCGGLLAGSATELFKPFVQKNENKGGLGLGLTIAQRAIELNHGTIEATNLPGVGCIFKIILPKKSSKKNVGLSA